MSPPPTTLTSPKLVPTFGASAHTGIPVYRLRALAQQGMPCVHIGRKLYFDLDEVDAWISQNLGTGGDTARPAANAIGADPDWVAEQLAKFTPDDLRRAGQLLLALANGGGAA
jgi:hypothetical protein